MVDDAMPVHLTLDASRRAAVQDWVGTLGWQVVDEDAAMLVPPVVTLTDVTSTDGCDRTPAVLLVEPGDDPVASASRALTLGTTAVLCWPDDRDELPATVEHLTATAPAGTRGTTMRVGGAAGGVGATTVALALGGLSAWQGRRTLVATRGDLPAPEAPIVDADALAAGTTWRAARAARGVPGLRVVAITGASVSCPAVEGVELTVHDVGPDDDCDVLVVRRDAAGLRALERSSAGTAVVVDQGPARAGQLREVAAGRRLVTVPFSTRVARAGLARRVPAGLPGAWLRGLTPVLLET